MASPEYDEVTRDLKEQKAEREFELFKRSPNYEDAVQREYEKLLADPDMLRCSLSEQVDIHYLASRMMHKDTEAIGRHVFDAVHADLQRWAVDNVEFNWRDHA